MKRILLASVMLATLIGSPEQARSGAYSVQPCLKSKLCSGLVEHFTFDEASDSPRFGAFGSVLHEVPGYNLPNSPIGGGTGAKFVNSASFGGVAASDWLWSSTFVPSMSSVWSMSFWFRPSSLPAVNDYVVLFSRSGTGNLGSSVILRNISGTGTVLCVSAINREATATYEACSSVTISSATTYLGIVGVGDPDDVPGATQFWVSLNGGAKSAGTPSPSFIPWSGISQFRVGQEPTSGKGATGSKSYSGWIDELSIFGRNIGPTDITLLYFGGTGRTYPFETE